MSELVSAFKCILKNKVEPLTEADRQEAYNILVEESLGEFLGYLEDKGCIDKHIRSYLSFELFLYEVDDNGEYMNYYEEDFDKRNELIEVVFDGTVDEYGEAYEDEEDEEDVKYVDEWQILYKDFSNEDEYFEEDESGAYARFEEVKDEGQVKQFIKKTYKVTDGHIEEDWVEVIYSDYGD